MWFKDFKNRRLSEGELLYSTGSKLSKIYVLTEGKVGLFLSKTRSDIYLSLMISPGDFFGQSPLNNRHYHTSAYVLESGNALVIDKDQFDGLLKISSDFKLKYYSQMARQILTCEKELADKTLLSPHIY